MEDVNFFPGSGAAQTQTELDNYMGWKDVIAESKAAGARLVFVVNLEGAYAFGGSLCSSSTELNKRINSYAAQAAQWVAAVKAHCQSCVKV